MVREQLIDFRFFRSRFELYVEMLNEAVAEHVLMSHGMY